MLDAIDAEIRACEKQLSVQLELLECWDQLGAVATPEDAGLVQMEKLLADIYYARLGKQSRQNKSNALKQERDAEDGVKILEKELTAKNPETRKGMVTHLIRLCNPAAAAYRAANDLYDATSKAYGKMSNSEKKKATPHKTAHKTARDRKKEIWELRQFELDYFRDNFPVPRKGPRK